MRKASKYLKVKKKMRMKKRVSWIRRKIRKIKYKIKFNLMDSLEKEIKRLGKSIKH